MRITKTEVLDVSKASKDFMRALASEYLSQGTDLADIDGHSMEIKLSYRKEIDVKDLLRNKRKKL